MPEWLDNALGIGSGKRKQPSLSERVQQGFDNLLGIQAPAQRQVAPAPAPPPSPTKNPTYLEAGSPPATVFEGASGESIQNPLVRGDVRIEHGEKWTVADAQVQFQRSISLTPAERPDIDPTKKGSDYLTLPPHLAPSAEADVVYERRAATVEAGQNAIILDYRVDAGTILYWSGVGTDSHLNSYYQFWADEAIVQAISGPAQVGTILSPLKFPLAVKVNKRVYMKAFNFNAQPFTYECVIVGWRERSSVSAT